VPAPERTDNAVPLVLTVPVAAFTAGAPSMSAPAPARATRPLRLIQVTMDPSLAEGRHSAAGAGTAAGSSSCGARVISGRAIATSAMTPIVVKAVV
jgi:hypothetical protein